MTASLQAQFSFVLRVRIDHRPGMLGRVATAIGEAGGTIGSIDLVAVDEAHTLRDMTVDAAGAAMPVMEGRDGSMTPIKRWSAESTDPQRRQGGPRDVVEGTDLFIGLSGARIMPAEALSAMADDARVFANVPSPFNRDVPAAVPEQATREGLADAGPGAPGYVPGGTPEFGAVRP